MIKFSTKVDCEKLASQRRHYSSAKIGSVKIYTYRKYILFQTLAPKFCAL